MQPRLHAAEFAPSTVSHGCMHGSSGVRKRSNPDIVLSNLLSLGHGKWVIAHHLGHLTTSNPHKTHARTHTHTNTHTCTHAHTHTHTTQQQYSHTHTKAKRMHMHTKARSRS